MPILTPMGELFLQAMQAEGVERVNVPRCTCGFDAHTVIAEVDRHGIPVESRLCLHCGTVRLEWQPAGGWLYSSGWYRRLHAQRGDEESRRMWQRRQWELFRDETGLEAEDEIPCITGAGELVEIGADTGAFCEAAREAGWTATPVEAGQPIPGSADEYVMVHVLEHMPDCIGSLRSLLARARKSSRLWCLVPNLMQTHVGEDARAAGSLRGYWTIAHPWNWTLRSIAFPFAHAGWHVIACRALRPGTFATVGSILVEAMPGARAARDVAWYCQHFGGKR